MPVSENPAPVWLQEALLIHAMPLRTCDVPSATPIPLPTAVSSLGLSQGCVCRTVGCFLGKPSILQDFRADFCQVLSQQTSKAETFGR